MSGKYLIKDKHHRKQFDWMRYSEDMLKFLQEMYGEAASFHTPAQMDETNPDSLFYAMKKLMDNLEDGINALDFFDRLEND